MHHPSYKVVSIVSQLPPQVNGVGDYAWCLAEKLESDYGVETLFIRTDHSDGKTQEKFKEEFLSAKSSSGVCEILENNQAACILLHYVGYAYSPRGCPFWLVQGMEAWKKKNPDGKVITIFHELYANGKIWQSAFWLHFFQKNIVFRLLKLSDGVITNTEVTEKILRSGQNHKNLISIPVFSNMGEPQGVPPFNLRDDTLIIFGSVGKRKEIYAHSLNSLLDWAKTLKVKKIIEIGPFRENTVSYTDLEIIQLGVLSPQKVSELLIRSKYGILQYPLALLSKSGIFAAYASHGMVPIVLGRHFMNYESNGLKSGFHYLYDVLSNTDHDNISLTIFKWYQGHQVSNLSARVFDMIKNKGFIGKR